MSATTITAEETEAETTIGPVLEGQVAVVTGASRGIGRAIAERLAVEGADVALLARSQHEVAEAAATLSRDGVRRSASERTSPAARRWTPPSTRSRTTSVHPRSS
jgi:NAD(P)-dependent dehydrogenase (short-subunit alcohol dehydrogenase family)